MAITFQSFRRVLVPGLLLTASLGLGPAQRERVVGLPCEGCDAVFEGMPATIGSEGRLAPSSEPGRPLVVEGVVTTAAGAVASGVIIYAYQTDAGGRYPPAPSLRGAAARHGRLRGWVRTDAAGRYRFLTIRPGGYPSTDIPEHIHLHVIEPGRCTYYIDDVVFEDDPRLTPRQRAAHDRGRGGSGIVRPTRSATGAWSARRDIRLGAGIDGYAQCGATTSK
jgi:hypothetical protein